MYSLLEQHKDGSWWYHPGDTFDTRMAVYERFHSRFWWDPERPHKVFEHEKPLFQEYSTCTTDGGETFRFAGAILWEK